MTEIHLHFKHQSNISVPVRHFYTKFNFSICDGIEGGRSVWAVFSSLGFALGVPAIAAILWEMVKTLRRGTPITPNDFFMLNLSTMDGIFLAFLPPGLINHLILHNVAFEALWNGIFALNTCGRPLLMACTCLDCYLAVVHPITYYERKSLTPRVVLAVIIWTVTLANGILFFLSYDHYYSFVLIVPFVVTIVIIVICDSFILYTLVRSDSGRKKIHPQKQRAIQTLVNSLVMTIFSYLPPVFLVTLGKTLISSERIFICTIGIPMSITSSLGSCIMPLLYLNNHGKMDCVRLRCWRKS